MLKRDHLQGKHALESALISQCWAGELLAHTVALHCLLLPTPPETWDGAFRKNKLSFLWVYWKQPRLTKTLKKITTSVRMRRVLRHVRDKRTATD